MCVRFYRVRIFKYVADIIVGAPWEESGVIYIYNGGPNLKQTNLQVSERIEAISLALSNTLSKMERFGFSTSTPVDIDGNGSVQFTFYTIVQ